MMQWLKPPQRQRVIDTVETLRPLMRRKFDLLRELRDLRMQIRGLKRAVAVEVNRPVASVGRMIQRLGRWNTLMAVLLLCGAARGGLILTPTDTPQRYYVTITNDTASPIWTVNLDAGVPLAVEALPVNWFASPLDETTQAAWLENGCSSAATAASNTTKLPAMIDNSCRFTEDSLSNITIETGDITATVDQQDVRDALAKTLTPGTTVGSNSIDALLAALAAVGVTQRWVISPNAEVLTLIHGDDYTSAAGRALLWTITGYPTFAGGTITLTMKQAGEVSALFTATGSHVSYASGVNIIQFEFTHDDTDSLPVDPLATIRWDAQVTLASGDVITVARGTVKVLEDVTE